MKLKSPMSDFAFNGVERAGDMDWGREAEGNKYRKDNKNHTTLAKYQGFRQPSLGGVCGQPI